jgi:HSP20 family protein
VSRTSTYRAAHLVLAGKSLWGSRSGQLGGGGDPVDAAVVAVCLVVHGLPLPWFGVVVQITLARGCHRWYKKSMAHARDHTGGVWPDRYIVNDMEVDTMWMRTDPFRDLDRLTQQALGTQGTLARPSVMPMDAWRDGDRFIVEFDLPGVHTDSIDLDVERNVVTVRAERPARDNHADLLAAERPRGVFSRQLVLGDNLDTDNIDAHYSNGVLSLSIPVAEKAKPRKITVTNSNEGHDITSTTDHQVINA